MNEIRERIRNDCLEKEEAFCANACPFHLDVPEFTRRLSRGALSSAYRLYSNAVGFPAIVAAVCDEPCAKVCARGEMGGAVSIRSLERASVDYTPNAKPNQYNLPPKSLRAAIVGAGVSGLACALRLANKKYSVTIFEKSGRLGGHLWDILSPEVFLDEFRAQFQYERYEIRYSRNIENLAALTSEYDAVYIATGKGGTDFGLRVFMPEAAPCASSEQGVFIGGRVLGGSAAESAAHGLRAAGLIEAYLKTGNMKSADVHRKTRMILDRSGIKPEPPVKPSADGRFSKENAAQEAARCMGCRCDACHRHCGLLRYFDKFPKKAEEEVHATIHPGSLDGDGTIATRFISSCNRCGLCKEVCPLDIDVGMFLGKSHQVMREKGAMPWVFHEFWLRDMEHAVGEPSSLIALPCGGACEAVFFPGCQLGASDPGYVLKSYDWLRSARSDVGVWLSCCGAPAMWAGEADSFAVHARTLRVAWKEMGEPLMILGCPSCKSFFAEYLPEVKTAMLYDILASSGCAIAERAEGAGASVFDPCAARHDSSAQESVRALAASAGYNLAPLPYERNRAQCCSWGGHIEIAAPNYSKWLANTRAGESASPYIVYCSNCRDVFAERGKPVKHILDVVFGLGGWSRLPPSASRRRRNREALKRELTRRVLPESIKESEYMEIPAPKLLISDELREKISESRLLEEDLLQVIETCERESRALTDEEGARRFAVMVIGNLTHWAEYAPCEEGYRLFNAYSHRMKIITEGEP